MDRRTDDEKIRGILPVRWGGEVREVPTLKRGASRTWQAGLGQFVSDLSGADFTGMDSLFAAGSLASDRMLSLVTSYDQSHVLGDPEWIDANVDETEVYAAFRMVLDATFPFVTDVQGLLAEVRSLAQTAEKVSPSPVSTSSPSPSGVSPRKR